MTEKEQKDSDTAAERIRALLEREGVVLELDGRVAKGEELIAACERIVKDAI